MNHNNCTVKLILIALHYYPHVAMYDTNSKRKIITKYFGGVKTKVEELYKNQIYSVHMECNDFKYSLYLRRICPNQM